MYYACFYSVSALLLKNKIQASTHKAVRQRFGEYFVVKGKFDKELAKHFSRLFESRQKGDYNDMFDYDEDSVLNLYPKSIEFVKKIEEILEYD